MVCQEQDYCMWKHLGSEFSILQSDNTVNCRTAYWLYAVNKVKAKSLNYVSPQAKLEHLLYTHRSFGAQVMVSFTACPSEGAQLFYSQRVGLCREYTLDIS